MFKSKSEKEFHAYEKQQEMLRDTEESAMK